MEQFLERNLKNQSADKMEPDGWIEVLTNSIHKAFSMLTIDPYDPVGLAVMDHARAVFDMRNQEIRVIRDTDA